MAIDVGAKKWGWAFRNDNIDTGLEGSSGSFSTESFTIFNKKVKELITTWKPKIIVVGKPNRMYNVIASHNKYIGVCCLRAEAVGIPLVELNDMSVRAACYPGKGGRPKEEIQLLTGIKDPDQSDAWVMAKGWTIMCQE